MLPSAYSQCLIKYALNINTFVEAGIGNVIVLRRNFVIPKAQQTTKF